jgi:hypothetical protein
LATGKVGVFEAGKIGVFANDDFWGRIFEQEKTEATEVEGGEAGRNSSSALSATTCSIKGKESTADELGWGRRCGTAAGGWAAAAASCCDRVKATWGNRSMKFAPTVSSLRSSGAA